MTEQEHAEISRRLALAIGWDCEDVQMVMAFQGNPAYCEVWPWGGRCGGNWKPFDYRAFDVIWPIAERFDCFPGRISESDRWSSYLSGHFFYAETAALAVARAVIAAKEKA